MPRARVRARWIWGVLAAVALLWPGTLAGPIDGIPLNGGAEAILLGVAFPALWWFYPDFLSTTLARTCIVALVAWNAFSAASLVQDGWCMRFAPTRAYLKDQLRRLKLASIEAI